MEMEIENAFKVVPYQDPYYDFPLTDQILMLDENPPSIGCLELPSIDETSLCNTFISESEVGFGSDDCGKVWDFDDTLLMDPFILEIINEHDHDFSVKCEGDASRNNGEGMVENSQIEQSLGTENQMQLSVLPIPSSSYNCAFCHILREIIHVNGKHVRHLELHGRVGVISHAILDKFYFDLSPDDHEHHLFDFCNGSVGDVKAFLVQYFEDCKREGYTMLQDPLSNFYQALCIGCNDNVDVACNDFLQSSPMVSGDLQSQQVDADSGIRPRRSDEQMLNRQYEDENKEARFTRSFLATQRERTGKMKLKDFSEYFHLPIHEAAKRMNVCPTVIKKKCRQGGLSRWPYRKIKGIKRQISKKQEILNAGSFEDRACAGADIHMLEQELQNIFEKFSC